MVIVSQIDRLQRHLKVHIVGVNLGPEILDVILSDIQFDLPGRLFEGVSAFVLFCDAFQDIGEGFNSVTAIVERAVNGIQQLAGMLIGSIYRLDQRVLEAATDSIEHTIQTIDLGTE
jgi:hypothetical protein